MTGLAVAAAWASRGSSVIVDGSGSVAAKRATADVEGVDSESWVSGSGKVEDGESWISVDQAALMVSMSKPSRRMRILAQESQFGGMRSLSRSTMLYLTVSRFRREWMPREAWIRWWTELVSNGVM